MYKEPIMNKDFISIADYSRAEIEAIFDVTAELKAKTMFKKRKGQIGFLSVW